MKKFWFLLKTVTNKSLSAIGDKVKLFVNDLSSCESNVLFNANRQFVNVIKCCLICKQ